MQAENDAPRLDAQVLGHRQNEVDAVDRAPADAAEMNVSDGAPDSRTAGLKSDRVVDRPTRRHTGRRCGRRAASTGRPRNARASRGTRVRNRYGSHRLYVRAATQAQTSIAVRTHCPTAPAQPLTVAIGRGTPSAAHSWLEIDLVQVRRRGRQHLEVLTSAAPTMRLKRSSRENGTLVWSVRIRGGRAMTNRRRRIVRRQPARQPLDGILGARVMRVRRRRAPRVLRRHHRHDSTRRHPWDEQLRRRGHRLNGTRDEVVELAPRLVRETLGPDQRRRVVDEQVDRPERGGKRVSATRSQSALDVRSA